MAREYTLTGQSVRKLSRTTNRLAKQPVNVRQTFPSQNGKSDLQAPEEILLAFNDTGDEIPAFACMAVVDCKQMISENGTLMKVLIVAQPDSTFRRQYALNGPRPIPSDVAQRIPQGEYLKCTFDGSTPALGSCLGPKPGEWSLFANYPQTATVVGDVDEDNKIALVRWQLITEAYATANGSISAGSSGAISIHQGTLGSTTAISGMDPTAYNAGPDVEADDPLLVGYILGQLSFVKLCS